MIRIYPALTICVMISITFITNVTHGLAKTPSRNTIKMMVVDEARNSIVPPELALAVAKVESDFNPRALSSAGARGGMQIMPKTAKDVFGVEKTELWDARLNIQLGIDYLAQLYQQYGHRWSLALSHYNGGTLKGRGRFAKPHFYTRKYVSSVMNWSERYADQALVWQVGARSKQVAALDNLDAERRRVSEKLKQGVARLSQLKRANLEIESYVPGRTRSRNYRKKVWRRGITDQSRVWTSWNLDENLETGKFDIGFASRLRRARETLDACGSLQHRGSS